MYNFAYININLKYKNLEIQKYQIGVIRSESDNKIEISFVNIDEVIPVDSNLLVSFDVTTVGDQFEYKICNVCHRFLPTNFFQKNQNGKDNRTVRRPSCVDCRVDIDGKAMSSKTKKMWSNSKPEYVIFECPICKKKTIPGLTSKVVLDHDHQTGEARGWICDSCNTGIGRFKDNTDLLKAAINFLEKDSQK